jgi:hypothetical protein
MMRTKILTITVGVCFAITMAQSSLAQKSPEIQYSNTELESMRTQLLVLTDTLTQLAKLAPPGYVDQDKLASASAQIKQMQYPQLNMLRQGMDPSTMSTQLQGAQKAIGDYLTTKAAVRPSSPTSSLRPEAISDPSPWPQVNGFCTTIATALAGLIGGSSGSDSTYGPTPIPADIVLAVDTTFFVADSVRELAQDACRQDVLGENGSLGCIPVDIIWIIAKALDESTHFCNDNLTDNVVYTNYARLDIIHTDLLNADLDIDAKITAADTDIDTKITAADLDIDTKIAAADLDIDTKITAADLDIDTKIAAADLDIDTKISALSSQVSQGTALLQAYLFQVMKLQLEPQGQAKIDPPILTCNGGSLPCPNVLAKCPAAGCSWNNVGPLP